MRTSFLRYLLAPFLALGFANSQVDESPAVGVRSEVGTTEAAVPIFEVVDAADVWAHPSRYIGRRITITLQTHSHPETWNPFVTRFGPGEFSCLRGWSDAQRPWLSADFERPLLRVFARRGGAADWAVEDAERYQRFELSCEVRAVFGDVPWLEVIGAKPLVRKLGDGAVMHAARGLDFMQKELWDAARLELERAIGGALPKPALTELEGLIERCQDELDKPELVPYQRP
jgi:hypothetical protein